MYVIPKTEWTAIPSFQKETWIPSQNTGFKQENQEESCSLSKFTGQYLTVSSLEQAMRRSVAKAELPKGISPHSLRHIFASHLMEAGVEQRNIQALLGHRDPKSTEVYLHVSNKTLMGIQSPFDRKEGGCNG